MVAKNANVQNIQIDLSMPWFNGPYEIPLNLTIFLKKLNMLASDFIFLPTSAVPAHLEYFI